MTKKEYLSQPFRLHRRIQLGLEQIERYKTLAQNGHAPASGGGGGSSGAVRSYVEIQTVNYMDIESQVKINTRKLAESVSSIKAAIYEMNNLELEYVLEARYINYRTWQQIADDLELSVPYVYRLHSKALNLFKIPS